MKTSEKNDEHHKALNINEHHGQITEHHGKNNEKGTASRKSKTLSEMDENNGKMNVT